MSIEVAGVTVDPPILLAPMAGITDLPFRRLVLSFGAGLVVSEMVATQELLSGRPGVRERAERGSGDARTAVQLAGRDPALMAEAARRLEGEGARLIDINMGCPAKKVTGGLSGSALMRTPDLAVALVAAVVGAVSVPVTVKMRLGWDDETQNAAELAARAEAAGAAMITVHGRTRCQFYEGRADWHAIRSVVDAVAIPVVANGDIVSLATARAAHAASGARGVMVGRGIRGAPWRIAEIAHGLHGGVAPVIPKGPAFAEMVRRHHADTLAFYGHELGGRVIRKHLGWYMDRAGTPAALRREVLTARPSHVHRLLDDALDRVPEAA